ncbi:MAG: hypothetical protein R3C45_18140 [Phycisphaerales bacterium]
MRIEVYDSKAGVAARVGRERRFCANALAERDEPPSVVATGASQLQMLGTDRSPGIRWDRVTVFHLDEYVGLPIRCPRRSGYL